MTRKDLSRSRSGCGLLVVACLVTCLLLIVNRLLAAALYSLIVPSRLDYGRLRTMIQLLVMIALLVPQWWLIDRVYRLARSWIRAAISPVVDDK